MRTKDRDLLALDEQGVLYTRQPLVLNQKTEKVTVRFTSSDGVDCDFWRGFTFLANVVISHDEYKKYTSGQTIVI